MLIEKVIDMEVDLENFDEDEIIEYVKDNIDLEKITGELNPIEILRKEKKFWGGIGKWDAIKEKLKELIED